jgi:hypothetical protein
MQKTENLNPPQGGVNEHRGKRDFSAVAYDLWSALHFMGETVDPEDMVRNPSHRWLAHMPSNIRGLRKSAKRINKLIEELVPHLEKQGLSCEQLDTA